MRRNLIRLTIFSFLLAGVSQGATVFSTITPIVIVEGSPVLINLNATLGPVTDTTDEVRFTAQDLGVNSSLIEDPQGTATVASTGSTDVERFEPGDSVGSSFTYADAAAALAIDLSFGFSSGNWGGGASGYVGIRFEIAGETHYGFVRIAWTPDNNGGTEASFATIDQIGYNTVAGDPAVIPVIPEPSALLLVCLGGFPLLRRKR